jgi:hypothetical protein
MQFDYVTGWRIDSEILPLQWRQINFDGRLTPSQDLAGTIRLDAGTTKTTTGVCFRSLRNCATCSQPSTRSMNG